MAERDKGKSKSSTSSPTVSKIARGGTPSSRGTLPNRGQLPTRGGNPSTGGAVGGGGDHSGRVRKNHRVLAMYNEKSLVASTTVRGTDTMAQVRAKVHAQVSNSVVTGWSVDAPILNPDPQAITFSSERQGSSAFDDVDPDREFGDLVEDEEHVQAIVYAARSPTAAPALLPPLATQQPLLASVVDYRAEAAVRHAELMATIRLLQEQTNKLQENTDKDRNNHEQLAKDLRDTRKELGDTKFSQDIAVEKSTEKIAGLEVVIDKLEGEISVLKTKNTALEDELSHHNNRMDLLEGYVLAGSKEHIIIAIWRRIALDQVQAELALRAGFLAERTASSSNDSAVWRTRLSSVATVDDNDGRLIAGKALLKTAADNDPDLKSLITSTAMELLTQKSSLVRHVGNTAAHEAPLKSLSEALNDNGQNKDTLAAIQSFLNLPGVYQSKPPATN